MRNCTGIIISAQKGHDYGELSKSRPDYMLPFGGRYRIIDFALSNMANYNLSRAMIYGGRNIRSTLDHIGDGKSWELNRRANGLLINPPAYDEVRREMTEMNTYFDSLPYYEYTGTEHVYIENPMTIAKVNLTKAYEEFVQKDLDVLLFYEHVNDEDGLYNGMNKVILDAGGRFLNIGFNLGTEATFNLYLGRLFIKKRVFIDLVKDAMERGNAQSIVQAILNHKGRLKIGTYDVDCHVEVIHDTSSYYRANMHLLDNSIYHELFYRGGMVYTKSKDEPSALYKSSSRVSNSLIANGCIIEGQVENSILFRGVHVKKGAIVRNSILIQKTQVGENAVVVNTITDKYAKIGDDVTVVGAATRPFVVPKNAEIEN